MSNIILETKDLKTYFKVPNGYLHAVDGVNIKIEKGKTLGVVGESGCGKSTLGRSILRLVEPTSGEIYFQNDSITKYSKSKMRTFRRNMQIIYQDPYSSLNPHMIIRDLIAEPMLINGLFHSKSEIYQRVEELMDTVGLASRVSRAYPHELDGGRRQRVGVARALSLNPQFIVCDEPVSALDVSIQAQILNLLMDLQDEKKLTYMFITHDLSVVKHISHEIVVMYLGQCIEKAPTKELFNNPKHPYTKILLSAIPVPNINMRDNDIEIIKGEITSPINPRPGCRFAPRCPISSEECTKENISMKKITNEHYVACLKTQ